MHGLLTLHGGVYEVKQEARRILSASIQGIAQTRLDRLPATEKHLLQVAAVIGPEVPVPLLQACMGVAEETLDHSLTHVQALEFLYETRPGPVRTYTFKHALVQDAAYASLLKSTRQQYHQRIAQVLAECFPETAETQPELIAQHYTAAGLHAEALPYWQRAGDLALKCSAYREAVASLERGLEALPHLPQNRTTLEQAVDLRLTLRSALLPSGDWERILALLREAESLATALEDSRRLGQVLLFLSLYFYLMSVYDQSITTGERALALATTSGDVVMRALANDYLGRAYRAQGDYRRAIDCFGQTVAALDGSRRHESYGQLVLPAVYSRAQLAECHTELGEFAEGAGIGEEGLRIVGEVAHPRSFM
jgi:tetratricopeptide (TPR) repeat protein